MSRTLNVGDSLSVGTKLRGAKVDARVGRSSREAVQVLKRKLAKGGYDTVVFDVGTNDGSAGELAKSIREAKRAAGGRKIVMATVNGRDAQAKNRVIRQSGVQVVDWASKSKGLTAGDGIHASGKGYQKRERMLREALKGSSSAPRRKTGRTQRAAPVTDDRKQMLQAYLAQRGRPGALLSLAPNR
jgi:folylpolyglutamate synthase/dihydropteroate synthase